MISTRSYILKVTENVGDRKISFILNVGDAYLSDRINPKLLSWFGYESVKDIQLQSYGVDILEIVELSNDNLQSQKEINVIKKKWINHFNGEEGDDHVCNQTLNNRIRDVSNTMLFNYCVIYNTVDRMSCNHIYNTIKKIWFTPDLKKNILLKRHQLLSIDPMEYGVAEYCVTMMFRDYLINRIKEGARLPFHDKRIYQTINSVISGSGIRRKLKIKQYYDENTGLSN